MRTRTSHGGGSLKFPNGSSAGNTVFSPLQIGAGGFLTGLDIAPDGTMVIRTDTFGAYKWNGTGWTQLLTIGAMPSGEAGHTATGDWLSEGVYEIVIAPSNSLRFYMIYRGRVFVSNDRGNNWTKTNFTAVSNCDPNDQGSPGRTTAQRMAVDPNNADVCYVGTPSDGLWQTLDAGVTWTQIASVLTATSISGGMIVCFDSASSVVSGKTQTIYVSSYGRGVYVSTNGGTSWTLTTSGPTTHRHTICRNGILWLVDDAVNGLNKYTGTWTAGFVVDGSQNTKCVSLDIDPSNSSRIVVIGEGGYISVSTNGGTSFSGWPAGGGASGMTRSAGAGEPAWLAWTKEDFMSAGNIRFHPTNSNELWFAEGIGAWVSNPPNTAIANAWSAKSQGIEQLVANGVISPPGGVPLVFAWDRPIFRVNNPLSYPATHGPTRNNAIELASSADWASSDPGCIVLISNVHGSDVSGKSNDGGGTWANFGTVPPNSSTSDLGGCIAASTNQNFVWIGAQNSLSLYYTTDGGVTWNASSITGPVTTGYSNSAFIDRQILCSDRVSANTFYLYYNGTANSDGAGTGADGSIAGIYKSTNSGASWSKVFSGRMNGNSNTGFSQSFYAAKLRSVPGQSGHLFFTAGDVGGSISGALSRSTNAGVTWSAVAGVTEALDVGFGAAFPGQSYPAVYVAGWVGGTTEADYGIWRSIDNCATWTKLTSYPNGNFDFVKCISGDSNTYGTVYVGFIGSGWSYGRL